jgi:hypothetical protein
MKRFAIWLLIFTVTVFTISACSKTNPLAPKAATSTGKIKPLANSILDDLIDNFDNDQSYASAPGQRDAMWWVSYATAYWLFPVSGTFGNSTTCLRVHYAKPVGQEWSFIAAGGLMDAGKLHDFTNATTLSMRVAGQVSLMAKFEDADHHQSSDTAVLTANAPSSWVPLNWDLTGINWGQCDRSRILNIFIFVQPGRVAEGEFFLDDLQAAPASGNTTGLVLWNKLGSLDEVMHSAAGPNLDLYANGSGDNLPATPGFAAGMFDNALTIASGNYGLYNHYHNVVLNNAPQYLSPEQGAVECWYKQNADPVIYSDGVHRIFDGDGGLGSGFNLDQHCLWPHQVRFSITFGGAEARIFSTDVSQYNGTWFHLAAVWNRQGIGGSSETMQLYVNGAKVAATSQNNWGTAVGSAVDIGGANDNNCANVFFVDNLKLWNYSKTDFSYRFQE